MNNYKNQAILRGVAQEAPAFSHETHGTVYMTFPLEVERLSGTPDVLNVIVSQQQLELCPVEAGKQYETVGEVRSFNNHTGTGRRLIISFFARSLFPAEGSHANELELHGVLCKEPIVRRTPLGREICDLLVAVNRRYGRADYLPCIAWGSVARACRELKVGDTVRVTGRFQSRKYRKVEMGFEEERTAYEVSVMSLEPVLEAEPVEV